MKVHVTNNDLRIYDAPPAFLRALDDAARYPSDMALMPDQLRPEGAWDGWVRLLRRYKRDPHVELPTGLFSLFASVAQSCGVPFTIVDERMRPEEGIPECGPIPLRGYQEEAVEAAIRAGRGVLDCPPRSGKTRLACEIVRRLALPTIWIAPTDRIVTQTQETFDGFFGRNYAVKLVGSANESTAANHHVVVCTAATAGRLSDEFYATRNTLIVDEFHHAAGATYKGVFSKCSHIYYRYGLTGTFFRSGDDDMAMHALLSNVVYRISPADLLERGHLVPTDVFFLPVLSPRIRTHGEITFMKGHGRHGIHQHEERNQMVALVAALLAKKSRKVLILVGTKQQGRFLKSLVTPLLQRGNPNSEFAPCEFVSTDMERYRINRILESFNSLNEVQVLIGTSLVGEGVDLPPADALVYARGEKAEVSLVQNAYRVCTAIEGKSRAIIVDFADRHNKKLLEHSLERLRVYVGNPTFNVRVSNSVHEFIAWVNTQC